MKIKLTVIAVALIVLAACSLVPLRVYGVSTGSMDMALRAMLVGSAPRQPVLASVYSIYRTAPLQVAMVFGRAQGCSDADAELIQATARAANDAGLDPAIAAATVAVESACNQYAISKSGAVGMMQVMPRIWKDHFDFAGDVNLFNRADNLQVGSKILAELIQQHGVADGLRRYNGAGVGCDTCDAGYTSKILTLAGRR